MVSGVRSGVAGAGGWARGLCAAGRLGALVLAGRRANGSGAYYDLLTGPGRRFWGESLHFGYFPDGSGTLAAAHDAHTDLVADLARAEGGRVVLDVGCGIAAPAARIARRHGCRVVGVNLSAEQVRQARGLVAARGLTDRVSIERADARRLPFADRSFDAIVCLEAAADICANHAARKRLITELGRVLKPGGHVGFTDFALRASPPAAAVRALRPFLCSSDPQALVCDWPALFAAAGFDVVWQRDILAATQPTWPRVAEAFDRHAATAGSAFWRRLAAHTATRLRRIPPILERYATYPALSAQKPKGPP